ncbi:hypothetical protein JTB14_001892 [Gonioctena quinquepunctata]|nr:hypothetical protein JTB14_001892 [Gonioctena quinquepunctata]
MAGIENISEIAKTAKNPDCFHKVEETCEVDAVSSEISFKLEVYVAENAQLKRIITELEEKYLVLNENCQLLRDKIVNIETIHQIAQEESLRNKNKNSPQNPNDKKTSTSPKAKSHLPNKEKAKKLSKIAWPSGSTESQSLPDTELDTDHKVQARGPKKQLEKENIINDKDDTKIENKQDGDQKVQMGEPKKQEEEYVNRDDTKKMKNKQNGVQNKNNLGYDYVNKSNNNNNNHKEDFEASGDWKTVSYRRHPNYERKKLEHKLSTGSRSSNEAMASLKVINRLGWIYLSGFHPDTTKEDLLKCLDGKFADQYICEKITKRLNPKMLSFKLGVPIQLEKQVGSLEFWPKGIIVEKYTPQIYRSHQKKFQKEQQNQQQNHLGNIQNTGYKLLHLNVQSVRLEFNLLEALAEEFDYDFICLNEHWLTFDEYHSVNLKGYKGLWFLQDSHGTWGGVCIYVKEQLKAYPLPTNISNISSELHFEVSGLCYSNLQLLTVRSPDGEFGSYMSKTNELLGKLDHKKNIIITGDFNVKFNPMDNQAHQLCNLFASYGLHYTVSIPTKGKNCLDNVFTNFREGYYQADVFDPCISDHSAINFYFKKEKSKETTSRINFRPITEAGLFTLYKTLENVNWNEVNDKNQETQVRFENFINNAIEFSLPKKSKLSPKSNKITPKINFYRTSLSNAKEKLMMFI